MSPTEAYCLDPGKWILLSVNSKAHHIRSTSLALQVLQSGTASTNLAGVLRLRNNNTDNDGVLQDLDLLLELFLQRLDKLAVSTESDLIGGLVSRLGAARQTGSLGG